MYFVVSQMGASRSSFSSVISRFLFPVADDTLAAQTGMLGALCNVFGIEEDLGEEYVEAAAASRCARQNGLGWQCANLALPDRRYCEKHLLRRKKKKADVVLVEEVTQVAGKLRPSLRNWSVHRDSKSPVVA